MPGEEGHHVEDCDHDLPLCVGHAHLDQLQDPR